LYAANIEVLPIRFQRATGSHEAHRETCTARATIYCTSIAAAILTAQYKKWAMQQSPEPHIHLDLLTIDVIH